MLIAICDDERQELDAIGKALSAAAELSVDIEIAAYLSGAAAVRARRAVPARLELTTGGRYSAFLWSR